MTRKSALSQELLHKIVIDGWPRDQTIKAIMARPIGRRWCWSDGVAAMPSP